MEEKRKAAEARAKLAAREEQAKDATPKQSHDAERIAGKEAAASGGDKDDAPAEHDDQEKLAGSPADLEAEADRQGAFNPETGEINWDCPCLGGMAHGPCGEQFKAAFSCFVFSEAEPKGMDCIDKFQYAQPSSNHAGNMKKIGHPS